MTVFGVGIITEGCFPHIVGGVFTPVYVKWASVLRRCYSPIVHKKYPSYLNCKVDTRWHYFQNFAEDYANMVGSNNNSWDLDKDLLFRGNKIYSKDTCVLLPAEINRVFVNRASERGEYPMGVCWHKRDEIFHAYCNRYGKRHHLGCFSNLESAFNKYKEFKEDYLKELAEKWKGDIDPRAYDAIVNYKILITD